MVDLYITYELGKRVSQEQFKNIPKKVSYKTALEVIKEIQQVMNMPYRDYREVYDKIGYILGEHNIYYSVADD